MEMKRRTFDFKSLPFRAIVAILFDLDYDSLLKFVSCVDMSLNGIV